MKKEGKKRKATDAELDKLYNDPQTGFQSAKKFVKRLRSLDYHNTLGEVSAWLKGQSGWQASIQPHKRKVFNSVVANYAGDEYEMDIMDYRKYTYQGWGYVLVVIDVYSRLLGVWPLKTREASEYTKAFKSIINNFFDGVWPRKIQADNEFSADIFTRSVLKKNVALRFTQPFQPNKNPIAERVILTLRNLLQRWRVQTGGEKSTDWVTAIMALVDNYNTSVHSTTKHSPLDIWNGRAKNEQKINWVPVTHKVGEKVRIILRERAYNPFAKSGERKVSRKVYEIIEQRGYGWVVKDTETDSVPVDQYGIEKVYMDYELVSIIPPQRVSSHRELDELVRTNATSKRLKKEDIFDIDENPTVIPLTQLGVLSTTVYYSKFVRGRQVVTPFPLEVDQETLRLDVGVEHEPIDPNNYDPVRSGWEIWTGPPPSSEPPKTTRAINLPENLQPKHVIRSEKLRLHTKEDTLKHRQPKTALFKRPHQKRSFHGRRIGHQREPELVPKEGSREKGGE